MNVGLDEYARNARLKPALITVLPAAWTVMVWSPGGVPRWSALWGLFVATGGTLLLAQMARDRGKRKERELFVQYGGRPTERLLSHAHAPNRVRLELHHARLRALLPDVHIPTADEEIRDPSGAREVYEACTQHVVARTRHDRLLFQENVSFGFRRNLWGLKPFGIACAAGSALVLGSRLYGDFSAHRTVATLHVIFESLSIGMLAVWLFWITPKWVMLAAYTYAERLFDALDMLGEPLGNRPRAT